MINETTLLLNRYNPSHSKSITPFQIKFKTPLKRNNETLHQQSLLLNDTDVTSDDEDHILPDFQNLTLPSNMTQHYKQKTILLLSN